MRNQNRRRDVLVMLAIVLTALALMAISYARIRAGQDVRTLDTTPVRR